MEPGKSGYVVLRRSCNEEPIREWRVIVSLKAAETDCKIADICREKGKSDATATVGAVNTAGWTLTRPVASGSQEENCHLLEIAVLTSHPG